MLADMVELSEKKQRNMVMAMIDANIISITLSTYASLFLFSVAKVTTYR